MFYGSMVALVTPMDEAGHVDYASLDKLIELHITAGTSAIIAVGTTGESATLEAAEQLSVIRYIVEKTHERIPVIAGTGANSTQKTIELSNNAMEVGVDACLIVTPYYNKPTQEGLYLHYKAIAAKIPLPIILYNVPARTACDLLPATIAKLAPIPNIIGIKEATGQVARCQQILQASDNNIDVYSGDDKTALALMLQGAKGVISVTANVAPELMQKMCQAALAGDKNTAREINQTLDPLHEKLFIESNPIPTKWALQQMGLIRSGIRLPLTPLSLVYHDKVSQALRYAKLL